MPLVIMGRMPEAILGRCQLMVTKNRARVSTPFHDDKRTKEIDNRNKEIDNGIREIDN